jgi:RND family efflux transporter MFP subunit
VNPRPQCLHGVSRLALTVFLVIAQANLCIASLQGPPAAVRTDAVLEELVVQKQPVTGELRAKQRTEVATREKGLLVELFVREGQSIRRGEEIAKLDTRQLELDLLVLEAQQAPAKAKVSEKESELAQAKRDLESLTALVKSKAANPKELDDAKSSVTRAGARLLEAQGQLKILEARSRKLSARTEDMTIRAPFNGAVTRRVAEVGAWLSEGESVVELLSTEGLEVWLEVPQNLYSALAGGEGSIEVSVTATGKSFVLKGFKAIPDIDRRARSFYVVGAASNPRGLASGMSVTALVPTSSEKRVLTIHRDAIMRNEVGSYVYSVLPGAEGKPASAAPVHIEVLFQTATRSVIRSARLKAGMQVVIEGNERLYPTAPISPISKITPSGGK